MANSTSNKVSLKIKIHTANNKENEMQEGFINQFLFEPNYTFLVS